jgi:hypothetical protein
MAILDQALADLDRALNQLAADGGHTSTNGPGDAGQGPSIGSAGSNNSAAGPEIVSVGVAAGATMQPARDNGTAQAGNGVAAGGVLPGASEPANGADPAPSAALQPAPTVAGAAPPPELDSESLRLLQRFLAGAVLLGSDELLERLRRWQQEIDRTNGAATSIEAGSPPGQAEQLRYFVLGSLSWGRRQAVQAANASLQFSVDTTTSLRGVLDAVTDNWLLRPLRRRVDDTANNLAREIALRIQEGQREDQLSRALAGKAIGEMVDDSIDYLSQEPALAELVREQLRQQSFGLAGTVASNGRAIGVVGDSVVESFARRLFRRPPRGQLPPSPLAGNEQTTYSPDEALKVLSSMELQQDGGTNPDRG